jgi:hypothetical protein
LKELENMGRLVVERSVIAKIEALEASSPSSKRRDRRSDFFLLPSPNPIPKGVPRHAQRQDSA